jgi:hypothetical protein
VLVFDLVALTKPPFVVGDLIAVVEQILLETLRQIALSYIRLP